MCLYVSDCFYFRFLYFQIKGVPSNHWTLNVEKNQTWFLFETSTIKMLLVVLVVLWRCFFFLIWLHYFYYCCSFRTGDCMESHFAYVTLLGFCSETWIQKPCFPPCQANIRCVCVCLMVALPTAGFTARHPGWWQKILGCLSRARWIGLLLLLLLLFRFCRKCLFNSIENCCIV